MEIKEIDSNDPYMLEQLKAMLAEAFLMHMPIVLMRKLQTLFQMTGS
jgi:hypothetical protein